MCKVQVGFAYCLDTGHWYTYAQMNKYFMYFNFLIYELDVRSLSLLYFATS